ncbi:MAG: hypothetical protein JO036_10515 [Candidatus Eremiobacteraeota bacterium]|nr:hypothetical protein [Candidatus Eremiobacteraeota bacterium]
MADETVDPARRADYVGKIVLVGLTYLNPDGSEQAREAWAGEIEDIREDGIVSVRRAGEEEPFTLPPELERAEPGEYRLRGTGEVVINPDFVASWTIQLRSAADAEANGTETESL